MQSKIITMFILLILTQGVGVAGADSMDKTMMKEKAMMTGEAQHSLVPQNYFDKMMHKKFWGFYDVITSPFRLIYRPFDKMMNTCNPLSLVTGLGEGAVDMLKYAGKGAINLATFPFAHHQV